MTTDEETNFGALVTSPSSTPFDIDFDNDKDISSLNCEDLFPNPPKYIPDTDQSLSNHEFNLECETFAGFSDETSKPSPGFLSATQNDTTLLDHIEEENSYSNSRDHFQMNGENDESNNTQISTKSISTNDEEKEKEKIKIKKSIIRKDELKTDLFGKQNHCIELEHKNSPRIQIISDTILKTGSTLLPALSPTSKASISLPSPALSLSSYYSSAESVTSDTGSKKKKKKHCHACNIHFKHTVDLLKHVRTHVSIPNILVTKLNENNVYYKEFLKRQKHSHDEPEVVENNNNNNNNSSGGSLKLKLKLSGSQNFEVVPINKKSPPPPTPPPEEKPKKGGIRVLKAQEIKLSPTHTLTVPPIDAMTAMSQMPIKRSPSENSLESRYFECPTFDGLDQFADEVPQEAADDLLKKLLENNSHQISQETDWSPPTNEFISIDRLAHICTVCNKNFPDGVGLFEHKRMTGHDYNNPMHPPPPPNKNHMNMQHMNQMAGSRHPALHPQHLQQMSSNQNYLPRHPFSGPPSHLSGQHHPAHPSHPSHPQHPQHLQHPSQHHPSQHPSQHHPSQHPSQHHHSQHPAQHPSQHHPSQHPSLQHPSQLPSHAHLMGMRAGYPPGYHPSQQQRYPVLPPNYTQSPQMAVRRPPPLYRAPAPQSGPPGTPPFNDLGIGQDIFYPPSSSGMMNGPSMPPTGPYPNGPGGLARPPVFLKARLQRAIRPKSQSPNGSPSPPIVMSQQQITRPKFLSGPVFNGSPLGPNPLLGNPQLNSQLGRDPQLCKPQLERDPRSKLQSGKDSQLAQLGRDFQLNNQSEFEAPPLKKIKREPVDDCEVISSQPRLDGLPIIQSVQGGASVSPPNLSDSLDKSKDLLQLNDQITLSLKNKDKNPKEVANMLANRGITVTHKPKNGNAQEDSGKNALTQEAVQKLQLNNSVSIISKKKNETNNGNINSSNEKDEPTKPSSSSSSSSSTSSTSSSSSSSSSSKNLISESPFISCPVPDCDEKFLTQESLNRHTQRGHRMNKVNLKPFRCRICPAMFSSQEGLDDHQRRNHRMMKTSADELGIPLIDLRNEQTKQKLAALGIINYIPLVSKGSNGCFGFPIVSVQGAANPNVCNVLGLGINSLLSLGPIKPIPTKKNDS